MNIDIVTQYILAIAPAVTAVISVVTAAAISVRKVKNYGESSNLITRNENKELKRAIAELVKENAELKKQLRTAINKIANIEE